MEEGRGWRRREVRKGGGGSSGSRSKGRAEEEGIAWEKERGAGGETTGSGVMMRMRRCRGGWVRAGLVRADQVMRWKVEDVRGDV